MQLAYSTLDITRAINFISIFYAYSLCLCHYVNQIVLIAFRPNKFNCLSCTGMIFIVKGDISSRFPHFTFIQYLRRIHRKFACTIMTLSIVWSILIHRTCFRARWGNESRFVCQIFYCDVWLDRMCRCQRPPNNKRFSANDKLVFLSACAKYNEWQIIFSRLTWISGTINLWCVSWSLANVSFDFTLNWHIDSEDLICRSGYVNTLLANDNDAINIYWQCFEVYLIFSSERTWNDRKD